MRAGRMYHRINFYARVSTRDAYGASVDTWTTITLSTRGELREVGGNKSIDNSEIAYSKSKELTVRYNSAIVDNMKIQIDGSTDRYLITYIEVLGMNEGIRLSIEKIND